MLRRLLLIGALSAASLLGCNNDNCEKPSVRITSSQVSSQEDDAVEAEIYVREYDSHIRIGCNAEYRGNGGVEVEVCAARKCDKANGLQAYVDFWPDDWGLLENMDAAYCTVTKKEEFVFEGPWWNPQLVEVIPAHKILSMHAELEPYCRPVGNGPTYCSSGYYDSEGWHCTNWHKSKK